MLGRRADNGEGEPGDELKLSRRSLEASWGSSLAEPIDRLEDEVSETPDAAPESMLESVRGRREGDCTSPPLEGLILKAPAVPVLGKLVRALFVDGRTNRSAMVDGGDLGRAVRRGRLAGGEVESSRCCFLIKVGVNSGPSSNDKNREESNDSRSSSRKWG
jgi:hypothetical protein